MLLKKIFKPKWQHNNPEVRIAAIAQLDWSREEDRRILESAILTDQDPRVVNEALNKVCNITDLLALIKQAPPEKSEAVKARLLKVVENAGTDAAKFIGNLLTEGNINALTDLATELKDHQQFIDLLDNLARTSPELLIPLITEHPLSKIRQMAAARIDDIETLTNIAGKIKSKDKGVYQKIKAKLQAHRQKEQEASTRKSALESVFASLESHAETEITKYYSEKLEALERHYISIRSDQNQQTTNLPLPEITSIKARIEHVLTKCQDRAAEIKQLVSADNLQQQELEQQAAERRDTVSTLEITIRQLQESASIKTTELAALDGLINTQETRWLEATRQQPVDKSEQKSYQKLTGDLRHYLAAGKYFISHESEISELTKTARACIDAGKSVEKDLLKHLRKCMNEIRWPENFSLPDLLQQSADIAGEIQTIQTQHTEDLVKQQKKAEEKIRHLSGHISNGELKQALRLAKDIHRELYLFPAKIKQDLFARLKTEQNRLDELKDWQGYATRPKQEELCERMEYLASQHLEPHIKAQRIKELQNEWRELGGPSDQKLWQRFKISSDKAFDPCKEFFSEEDKLKEANLQKRESICSQLGEFIEQIDWHTPDWKALEKINRKAREEWRLYYPVDHKQAKPVQHRFNSLLAEIDKHMAHEKDKNHRLKSAIIAEANALITLPDVKDATSIAKALQKKWQKVGITEHKNDRLLWSTFRKACDQIFARLAEQSKEQQAEQEKLIARANELTEAVTDLKKNTDASTQTKLASFVDAFNALGEPSRTLTVKFQNAVEQIKEELVRQQCKTFKEYQTGLIDAAIARLQNNPADDASLVKTSATTAPTTSCELTPEHKALISRPILPAGKPASDILLRMEILAEIESPEAEKAQRLALQVARLTAGLNNRLTDDRGLRQKFEAYLTQWIELSQSEDCLAEQRSRLINIMNKVTEQVDFNG